MPTNETNKNKTEAVKAIKNLEMRRGLLSSRNPANQEVLNKINDKIKEGADAQATMDKFTLMFAIGQIAAFIGFIFNKAPKGLKYLAMIGIAAGGCGLIIKFLIPSVVSSCYKYGRNGNASSTSHHQNSRIAYKFIEGAVIVCYYIVQIVSVIIISRTTTK